MSIAQAVPSFQADLSAQARECPSCGGLGLEQFYSVDQVPAHCCLLMATRDRAMSYPHGDIRLAFCPACGFVTNTAFDPLLLNYSAEYEETQGFSPTFNTFARRLADDVVRRFDLRGKRFLEIGCGKGEFLTQLCDAGMAGGVGIDPAYLPDRLEHPALDRIEFIRDLYSPSYSFLKADLICCRHTLEHIGPTLEFLSGIRESIGEQKDAVVLFELPDVLRVLREPAFWDIYYEHCSYFSPGSLARLFRRAGFEIDDLWMEYAGQYILIAARPAATGAERTGSLGLRQEMPLEEDLGEMAAAVEDFRRTCPRTLDRWRTTLSDAKARGRRAVLWGSGSKGVSFLTTLGITDEAEFVVDINPHKHGRFMPGSGQRIVGPEFLLQYRPDLVVVMNPVYVPEITRKLREMGLGPQVLAV